MGTNGGTAQINGNAVRDDERMPSFNHSDAEYSGLVKSSEVLVRHWPKGRSLLRLLKESQPALHRMDFIIISEEKALSKGSVAVAKSGVALKSLSRITDVSSFRGVIRTVARALWDSSPSRNRLSIVSSA
jgi:hypothetical protein